MLLKKDIPGIVNDYFLYLLDLFSNQDIKLLKTIKLDLNKITGIIRLTAMALIIYKLVSFKLWLGIDRWFPKLPMLALEITEHSGLDLSLNILSLLLLVVLVIWPGRRIFLAYAVLELCLIIFDANRLQPMIYQCLVLALVFFLKPKTWSTSLLVILAITYTFSGLHKLNLIFINTIWSPSILVDTLGYSYETAFSRFAKGIGFSIGLIEFVLGLTLLTSYRRYACKLLILMHLIILAYIGPIGLNFNEVVWVWNILMIIYLWSLLKNRVPDTKTLKHPFYIATISLLCISPILYPFKLSNPYTSFSLYSGIKMRYIVDIEHVPKALAESLALKSAINTKLNLNSWSYSELKVPFSHQYSYFLLVVKQLQKNDSIIIKSAYQLKYPFRKKEKIILK